eukprot:913965-Amphidinium_carterae.1
MFMLWTARDILWIPSVCRVCVWVWVAHHFLMYIVLGLKSSPDLEVQGGARDAPWRGVMSDQHDQHRRRDRDQDLPDEREPLRRKKVEHKGAPATIQAQQGQPSAAAASGPKPPPQQTPPPPKPKGPPAGVIVTAKPEQKPKGPPAGVTVVQKPKTAAATETKGSSTGSNSAAAA